MSQETISLEEFDKRLEASNARLRQEASDVQERIGRLELLIARKEAFSLKLDRILEEIEQEEAEIRAFEDAMRPKRAGSRRRSRSSVEALFPLLCVVQFALCMPFPADITV